MTKEQIRKAAKDVADRVCDATDCIEWENLVFTFEDGAKWRINSVWHKPEEMPETDRQILIERTEGFEIYIFTRSYFFSWKDISRYNLVRWAYIDDLIPIKDETA